MKQILKSILILGLFTLEFFFLKFSDCYGIWFLYTGLIFVIIDIVLYSLLIYNNKIAEFKTFFGKTFNSVGASLFSIISIIYMLAHIGWIINLFETNFNTVKYQNFENLPLYVGMLFFPFLLLSFFVKQKKGEIHKENRKLMITSISLFDNQRKDNNLPLSDFEKTILKIVKENEHYNNWQKDRTKVNWQPIFQSIEFYPNIREVLILTSKESNSFINALRKDETYKEFNLRKLMKKFFPDISKITFITLTDAQNIQITINQVTQVIDEKFDEYKDEEIVFGITGGTAIVSSALSMLATKGLREIVYKRQDNSNIVQDSTNIFNVKELWQEIIEKFE